MVASFPRTHTGALIRRAARRLRGMHMQVDLERRNLLQICRAVMPGVAGVVLSTHAGGVVAHEETRVADPHTLAREAAAHRDAATSTLVPHEGGLYLVVFVPQPLAEELGREAVAA